MAASGRHVGHYMQRNGRFLTNNLEQLWSHRSFGWTPSLRQTAVEANKESTENIVIPRKKTWSKVAVLEALASTVGRDPTAYNYKFQDDSYLSPGTLTEFKLYSLSQESGRTAAKFFINSNPKFFTEDFAEPHIPCLMPETVSPLIEEVSEEALKERINLRRVKAAVDMYDQLLQAGTTVSMRTTHDLLDLICLYCDKNPVQEGDTEAEDVEAVEGRNKRKVKLREYLDSQECTWEENNSAERIFNVLPERDAHCYAALIRGMVKHGAHAKAFSMYTDLLNERLTADVHVFNALILAAPHVRDKYSERWNLIEDLLKQMNQQKVQPNLLTFNCVLKSLRLCGSLGKAKALHTLNEMMAVGIAPSLASFEHILVLFHRSGSSGQPPTDLLQDILSEIKGTSFTCQDPEDDRFFSFAMKICLDAKDMELGYKVQSLADVGNNWRLLGDPYLRGIYYGRFFSLLCLMEHIDVILKWYKQLVPSLYYPSFQACKGLLQALDADNRLDLLPQIWKDFRSLGHDKRPQLVEELLTLMAREKHSPEVQERFAECALDIKGVYDDERGRASLQWNATSLTHITSLLLRANKTQQAWEMLQLFTSNNRVPPDELLKNFLSVCHSSGSVQTAVDLVQLSAAFCLPATAELAKQTLADFKLTEEQRAVVSELESTGESLE
ncbi:hypothetical protein JOB18_023733 [Solea senegalensis]|uniref:Pentatricopeptide repeat domain 3 n=2 Tax=Solea senegalensis TaxID=28829 RepID=A0AAV6SMG5_SOLSE|nr:pentatricopeptide repeat domain-containing protein 3, mitochondrial [Solea senegalensis]KAG7518068.1 hypothetical protein JOB18_023733 [Solea senegalensis]